MYKNITLLLSLAILLASCTKEQPACHQEKDSFVFGDAFGFCGGDCAHLYQVRNQKLYPDNIDNFYVDPLSFSSSPMADSLYQLAITLSANLPAYLENHPDTTFGCPDCMDQGLMYIEVLKNGTASHWRLDRNIAALPVDIQQYAQDMSAILERLN